MASNSFAQRALSAFHKTHRFLGFEKGYTFVLFFVFAGALLGFLLARAPYLDIQNYYRVNAGPGEWYYFDQRFYNIGISLHLICIIPCGILVIVQFTPVIRHRYITFHRANGYLILLLLIVGVIGALMITRHAFGGGVETQTGVGALALMTLVAASMAYYNIKRLRVDQHRAWMLRCWFWAGSIITLRLIFFIAALVISRSGDYYDIIPCKQLILMNGNADGYPACSDENALAIVHANLINPQSVAEAAAALRNTFGMAGWLAWFIHAIGVEIYLNLTLEEAKRLQQISRQKQIQRGWIVEESDRSLHPPLDRSDKTRLRNEVLASGD